MENLEGAGGVTKGPKDRKATFFMKLTNEEILLKAHQNYIDWWLPIDVAHDSFLAPMGLLRFCRYMLIMPDEECFDKWINEKELQIPKDGNIRLAKIYMKEFILKMMLAHHNGYIDLHDKGNEFKTLKV